MLLRLVLAAAALLAGCAPPPPPPAPAKPDPTAEPWYAETVTRLRAINQDAGRLFRARKPDEAAALITQGQPLIQKLLAVPRPTLEAMEAASDLDDLYGRMLLSNKHPVWARQFFQKNAARWKYWQPQTADTARRLKIAMDAVAECDRQ